MNGLIQLNGGGQQCSQRLPEDRFTRSFILIIIALITFASIYPVVPLTYDEAWNFSNISSKGPFFTITNYPFPNNHVLFSLIQALVIPNKIVYWWPPLLRLVNVVICSIMLICLDKLLQRNGICWPTRLCAILCIVFAVPTALIYCVVARGYMLGILLLSAASVYLAREKLVKSAALAALSAYTVPTFGYALPGLAAAAYVFSPLPKAMNAHAITCGVWRMAVYASAVTLLSTALYIPVLQQLLSQKNTFRPFTNLTEFTTTLISSCSSLSYATQSLIPGVGIVIMFVSALAISCKSLNTNYTSEILRIGIAVGFACLSMFAVTVMLYSVDAINLPFLRALAPIPLFANVSIIFTIMGLSGDKPSLKVFLVPLIIQAAAGACIFVFCFVGARVLQFPHFAELTPSPIERAFASGILPPNSRLVTSWSNEPVLELYSGRMAFKFSVQPIDRFVREQDSADSIARPPAHQEIRIVTNDGAVSLYYTPLWTW